MRYAVLVMFLVMMGLLVGCASETRTERSSLDAKYGNYDRQKAGQAVAPAPHTGSSTTGAPGLPWRGFKAY